MATTRMQFELDPQGVAELLKDPAIGAHLKEIGDDVAANAAATANASGFDGAEFNVRGFVGRDRQRVHVAAQNHAAYQAEVKARALTRARGGAR
ncbi:hypothetical protein [Kocuria sp.]|uniref:hypothetical protein n=1 Tax=Kocuria sp. TaxID=1871328 RepID=UPI0026DBB084|nr:hypothetical protein [Kocuria sp.]MDO4920093.1 hypothetical protein [Kocuria sp.]